MQNLHELRLSRVYTHFTKPGYPVALITAFRGEFPIQENIKRNYQLASILSSNGFGYVWVDGAWIENKGTKDEKEVKEVTLMVIGHHDDGGKMLKLLKEMASKYNQDGFLYKDEQCHTAVLDRSGDVVVKFSKVGMDTLSQMYTKLRSGDHAGRPFIFQEERVPANFFTRLAKKAGPYDSPTG